MGQTESAGARRRDSVFLLAKVAGPDGATHSYRARNLSPDGVCIERPDGLEVGAKLTLSIGLVEGIRAEVVWARDGLTGLKFAASIDPARARKRPPQSLDPKTGWGRISAP